MSIIHYCCAEPNRPSNIVRGYRMYCEEHSHLPEPPIIIQLSKENLMVDYSYDPISTNAEYVLCGVCGLVNTIKKGEGLSACKLCSVKSKPDRAVTFDDNPELEQTKQIHAYQMNRLNEFEKRLEDFFREFLFDDQYYIKTVKVDYYQDDESEAVYPLVTRNFVDEGYMKQYYLVLTTISDPERFEDNPGESREEITKEFEVFVVRNITVTEEFKISVRPQNEIVGSTFGSTILTEDHYQFIKKSYLGDNSYKFFDLVQNPVIYKMLTNEAFFWDNDVDGLDISFVEKILNTVVSN